MQRHICRRVGCLLATAVAGLTFAGEPVPFSHQRHAALRRPCVECHTGGTKSARAGFPDAAQCQRCHTREAAVTPLLKRVAEWPLDARPFPGTRLYRVKEYVIFGHAAHARASIACAECHGDVARQDQLAMFREVTMKACVECHSDRQASLACNLCHELAQ